MMKKRKFMVSVLCVVMLCGVLACVVIPRDVAPQVEQITVGRVQRMVGDAEFEDITSQIDAAQLAELLTSCKASRLPFYQQS